MATLQHQPISGNPCRCRECLDIDARDLAAHLGMAPADGPDDDLDLAAEHAERISWGGWESLLKRPADADDSTDYAWCWEMPDEEDRAWAAQWSNEGCGPDDLSPWEQEFEMYEDSWERACRIHAEEMEELALEATYFRLIETFGGLPADW